MRLTWLLKTNFNHPKVKTQRKEQGRETGPVVKERKAVSLEPLWAFPCRLAALVPAVPWWFRRTVLSCYVFFFFVRSMSLNQQWTFFFFNLHVRISIIEILVWFNFWLGVCELGLVLYHLVCLFFPSYVLLFKSTKNLFSISINFRVGSLWN